MFPNDDFLTCKKEGLLSADDLFSSQLSDFNDPFPSFFCLSLLLRRVADFAVVYSACGIA